MSIWTVSSFWLLQIVLLGNPHVNSLQFLKHLVIYYLEVFWLSRVLIGMLKIGKDVMLCYSSFFARFQMLLESILSVTGILFHRLKNKRMNKSTEAISTHY